MTAEEAYKIANEHKRDEYKYVLEKEVFPEITEEANSGNYHASILLSCADPIVHQQIIKTLNELGYSCSIKKFPNRFEEFQDVLYISWSSLPKGK